MVWKMGMEKERGLVFFQDESDLFRAENYLAGEGCENFHFQGRTYEVRLCLSAMQLAECCSPSTNSLRHGQKQGIPNCYQDPPLQED